MRVNGDLLIDDDLTVVGDVSGNMTLRGGALTVNSVRPTVALQTPGDTATARFFSAVPGGRVDLTTNLYYDGGAWRRDDVSKAGGLVTLFEDGRFGLWTVAAGGADPASIILRFDVTAGGNTTVQGNLTVNGTGGNVALKTIDNNFVVQTLAAGTSITGNYGSFLIRDTGAPANQRLWRWLSYNDGTLHLEAYSDDQTVFQARPLSMARNGQVTVGGATFSGGVMTAGSVPDARLSSNVALKNVNNAYTARQDFAAGLEVSPGQFTWLRGNATVSGNLDVAGSHTGNVALRTVDNNFTVAQTFAAWGSIRGGNAALVFNDVSAPVDARIMRFLSYSDGNFRWDFMNDAGSAIQGTPIHFIRPDRTNFNGPVTVSGALNVNNSGGNVALKNVANVFYGGEHTFQGTGTAGIVLQELSYGTYIRLISWSNAFHIYENSSSLWSCDRSGNTSQAGLLQFKGTYKRIYSDTDNGLVSILGGTNAVPSNGAYFEVIGNAYGPAPGCIHGVLGTHSSAYFRVYSGSFTEWLQIRGSDGVLSLNSSYHQQLTINSTYVDGGYAVWARSGVGYGWIGAGKPIIGGAYGPSDFCIRASGMLVLSSANDRIEAPSIYNNSTPSIPNNVCIDSSGTLRRYTSSRRYKHAITPLTDWQQTLLALTPVAFIPNDSTQQRVGFIAEDVAAVDPRLVAIGPHGPDEVAYGNLTAPLVAAIQELHARLVALEERT